MKFYIIYSYDTMNELPEYLIPNEEFLLDRTEDNDGFEYEYLLEETGLEIFNPEDENQENGIEVFHGKWVGEISKDQMESLCDTIGLYPDDCETMGSLTEHGHLPAISFRMDTYDDDNVISCGAYVTPLPETLKDTLNEQDWARCRKAVIHHFR